MGEESDKWISWGACIPDSMGNFYYTSFSPAGFVLPYLFIKLLNLDYTEFSLYIFNTLLLATSASIFLCFMLDLYKYSTHKYLIAFLGILLYVFEPEVLHGMGNVYWHQSIMQVTLIAQIYAFYRYRENGSKLAYSVFLLIALVNPYIEWTGYIANAGFALAEIFRKKKDIREGFMRAAVIMGVTLLSFAAFCGHYLSTVDSDVFFDALQTRFTARSSASAFAYILLLFGYLKSFKFLWAILTILVLYLMMTYWSNRSLWFNWMHLAKEQLCKRGYIVFVAAFPILENFIMKQHAVEYTYDRMKLLFVVVIVFSAITCLLFHTRPRRFRWGMTALVCGGAFLNWKSYADDASYRWRIDYKSDNEILSSFLSTFQDDAVYGLESKLVRGYINLLIGSGVHEKTNADRMKTIATTSGKRYAITLYTNENPAEGWNMYELSRASVYDTRTNQCFMVQIRNGAVVTEPEPAIADFPPHEPLKH